MTRINISYGWKSNHGEHDRYHEGCGYCVLNHGGKFYGGYNHGDGHFTPRKQDRGGNFSHIKSLSKILMVRGGHKAYSGGAKASLTFKENSFINDKYNIFL